MPYKNIERRREYGRDWMRRNLESARIAMRRWRATHPEAKQRQTREYYRLHRDEIIAKVAVYQSLHPEIGRTRSARRRTREVGAEGSYAAQEWRELRARYGYRCAYCRAEGPLEADHAIPLCRGGTNYIENIRPACVACNRRKGRLTEEEFRARLDRTEGG